MSGALRFGLYRNIPLAEGINLPQAAVFVKRRARPGALDERA